jgi:hypothetical protein
VPPTEESQLDQSKEHSQYVSGGTLGMLLETAKRWGIFAGIVVAMIGWVLWLTGRLLTKDAEREAFIRTELTSTIKDATKSNVAVEKSVDQFKDAADELVDAIEDLTKVQIQLQKTENAK